MFELFLAAGLAVFISAMCSLFEAVLYSMPAGAVEHLAQAGSLPGKVFRKLRQEVQKPIAAILSLNTIANTAGAAIAGAAFVSVFGAKWLFAFSAVFTVAILVFSEIIPKTVGVIYHKSMARVVALPLQGIVWLLSPLVWIVNAMTKVLTPSARDKSSISPHEIISLARLGRREGSIEFLEEKVIENILMLDSKKAQDIMTPRTVVFSLDASLTLDQAREQAGVWPHSRMPVFQEDREDIVGLVMRRDALSALADGQKARQLCEFMRPVHFVPTTARADLLLKEFLEKRQHLFVVIDEFGGVAGVVSLEDVLEEIIGREIVDEFDQAADMSELARQRRRQIAGRTG
jgi:CBS domain containing-hemolysin-like protein